MTTPAKKAPAKKAAPKLGNPDEIASAALKPPQNGAPTVQDAYTQLALEWALRRAFDGPAWPAARRRVEKEPMISNEVRQVLLDRIDLMG